MNMHFSGLSASSDLAWHSHSIHHAFLKPGLHGAIQTAFFILSCQTVQDDSKKYLWQTTHAIMCVIYVRVHHEDSVQIFSWGNVMYCNSKYTPALHMEVVIYPLSSSYHLVSVCFCFFVLSYCMSALFVAIKHVLCNHMPSFYWWTSLRRTS